MSTDSDDVPLSTDSDDVPVEESCKHYQRKCSLVAPCCKKSYKCRICHDEVENHKLDRSSVRYIICVQCHLEQSVQTNCKDCGILFGKYSCLVCRLFDDNTDKGQFHCEGCGICRIGGRDFFYHCPKCNMCISVQIKESHKCLADISRNNCPVCLEDIHTSRTQVHVPECGHLLHLSCLNGMLKHGSTSCPICNKSLLDMKEQWKMMDEEISNTIMPDAYLSYLVNVLCRDCHTESKVAFHVLGLKCHPCGSYNTARIGGDGPAPQFDDLGNVQELNIESDSEHSWETLSDEEVNELENSVNAPEPTELENNTEAEIDNGNTNGAEENNTSISSNNEIISEPNPSNTSNNVTDDFEIE